MKVFYRKEQSVPKLERSFSPSMGKPALVITEWMLKYATKIELVGDFQPVSRDMLKKVHSKDHVDGVLDLHVANGFGTRDPEIAASLPYTSGSMVAAALAAYRNKEITCSPTSGFHHAGFDSASGFCTFNGLMVAVDALLHAGARKIGILDLDDHYGNGTDDILDKLGLEDQVFHFTVGGIKILNGEHALSKLGQAITSMLDVDVILYQAGADSHVDDPLGGIFTTEEYRRRDRMVFKLFSKYGIPIAWNLAGGYQTPVSKVVALHNITLEEAVAAEKERAAKSVSGHREKSFV